VYLFTCQGIASNKFKPMQRKTHLNDDEIFECDDEGSDDVLDDAAAAISCSRRFKASNGF